jgi:hypothetical protein
MALGSIPLATKKKRNTILFIYLDLGFFGIGV